MENKKQFKIVLGFLFVLYMFMHVYRLGEIPYGIHCDEMGMGYDSWCLANYGIDRYRNSFPVYLINFSGGQSALYAYLCIPFVKILGFSAIAFRIPILIFAVITFFFTYKISEILWDNRGIYKLITMGILTVCPVFTMLFRIGLDCNLMLGLSTALLYFIMKAIKQQNLRNFIIVGLIGGLTLYSYVLSHFVMPVFLLLICTYLLILKKVNIKQLIVMWIPILLLALPLVLFHIVNIFDLEEIQIGFITIPKLYRYRSNDMSFSFIVQNMKQFFEYTLLYDGIKFASLRNYPPMYLVTIPFIFIGLIYTIYYVVTNFIKKVYNEWGIILSWMIGMYITGILLGESGPIVYRMNAVYIVYLLFAVKGINIVYSWINNKASTIAKVFAVILTTIYCMLFLRFAIYYFTEYTQDTYLLDYFNFTYEDIIDYIENEVDEEVANRTTYVGDVSFSYIYFLGSTGISPYEYNELADDSPYTLYLWMESYKNYKFNLPEEIDTIANYIIPETSTEYIDLLDQYNFTKVRIGNYYLYTNPWLGYTGENSECVLSFDHGMNAAGKIVVENSENSVLSGWAFDASYGQIWDDILLQVNGRYYSAQKMERQDVAQIIGNDQNNQCGFHFTINSKDLKQVEEVKFICINYEDSSCYVTELEIEKQ